MSEPKVNEKKVVGRSVAVALGIICIILVAGLSVVMAYYTMQINNKDSAYNDYVSTHSHTNSEYNSLNSQVGNLQNQVNDLTSTLNLDKSTVLVNNQTISEPANSWGFLASYAGYVSVYVQSSSVNGTHVYVIYYSHGVSFNQEIVVNAGDTANFPVLPPSSIHIEVNNSNLINGATETVTITYYY